jgi:hypothetical protein
MNLYRSSLLNEVSGELIKCSLELAGSDGTRVALNVQTCAFFCVCEAVGHHLDRLFVCNETLCAVTTVKFVRTGCLSCIKF